MDQSNILIGLPRYFFVDYAQAKAVMVDGETMPDTFEQRQEMQMRIDADPILRGRAVSVCISSPTNFANGV
jgi:hypothetical protein